MRALVYGTGMTGIAHAFSLAEAGAEVTLAGASDSFAAGWSSDEISLGGKSYNLPRGIRLPVLSGTSLDKKFFSQQTDNDPYYYRYQNWTEEGCIQGEFSNHEISCIDLSELELNPHAFNAELKSVEQNDVISEQDRLEKIYGKTIVEKIFQPLAQPRFGCSLELLPPFAMDGLISKRFVFPPQFYASENTANHSLPAPILAARTRAELEEIPHLPIIYPVNITLSSWVSRLQDTLCENGVKIALNCPLEAINIQGKSGNIKVRLNGEDVSFDLLIWAGSPLALVKAITADLAQTLSMKPQNFRCFAVAHIACSGQTRSAHEFVSNFCSSSNSHRYKLWQNFKAAPLDENIISVEIASLGTELIDVRSHAYHAISELETHGYLSADSQITDIALIENTGRIPVFSISQMQEINALTHKLKTLHPMLSVVSANGIKFLHQILYDAAQFTKNIQKVA